jgi:hypothetical protein
MDEFMNIHCSRCHAPMTCNPGACWCQNYPPLLNHLDAAKGCYCESCLKSLIEASGRDHSTADKDKSP